MLNFIISFLSYSPKNSFLLFITKNASSLHISSSSSQCSVCWWNVGVRRDQRGMFGETTAESRSLSVALLSRALSYDGNGKTEFQTLAKLLGKTGRCWAKLKRYTQAEDCYQRAEEALKRSNAESTLFDAASIQNQTECNTLISLRCAYAESQWEKGDDEKAEDILNKTMNVPNNESVSPCYKNILAFLFLLFFNISSSNAFSFIFI